MWVSLLPFLMNMAAKEYYKVTTQPMNKKRKIGGSTL